jgi:DNA primase
MGKGFVAPEIADAVEDGEEKPEVEIPMEDFYPLWEPPNNTSAAFAHFIEYLRSRGFSADDIRNAKIHGAVAGKYMQRLIVPHMDAQGVWWGFTSRVVPPDPNDPMQLVMAALQAPTDEGGWVPPKVLYPKGMDRGRMYNEQALQVETDRPVMVVEGCLDSVWYLPDVVASLGKPTPAHREKLLDAKRPIVVCLDGDAWLDARLLSQILRLHGKDASYVKLPPKQDPNSVDPNWLKQQVEKVCKTSSHSQSSQTLQESHDESSSTNFGGW